MRVFRVQRHPNGGAIYATYVPGGNQPLVAEAGSFSYAGGDSFANVSGTFTADSGSFAYNGGDSFASILYPKFVLDSGSFTYVGGDSERKQGTLKTDTGYFVYTGGDTLARQLYPKFVLDTGTFSYAGGDSDFFYTQIQKSDSGVFSYTGGDTTAKFVRVNPTDSGVFTYVGGDTFATQLTTLVAESGPFSYQGSISTVRLTRLANEPGVFTYVGEDTQAILVGRVDDQDLRMKTPDGIWVPIGLHKIYGPKHTDVDTSVPLEVGSGLVWDGFKFQGLNLWSVAGYGGIRQSAPTALSDISTGVWIPLEADTAVIAVPRGVEQIPATNSISFDREGVWQLNLGFSISHNESQQSRNFKVRLYNIIDDTATAGTLIGIGRNTDVTTFSTSILLEIGPDQLTDDYQVQIGDSNASVTSIVENSYNYSTTLVSEWRG